MTSNQGLKLKREVGLISAISLVAGTMIGSGIFMSPQFVMSNVGSPGASLIIWAVCGLVTLCAALTYAELGTMFRESGGEFIYVLRIYGPLPAFFVAFTFIIVVKPAGIVAVALSFAQYAVAPFYPGCMAPTLVVKFIAVVCIFVVAAINMMNVRFAMAIQVIFLLAKVVGLMVIVIGGIVTMAQNGLGNLGNPDTAFESTTLELGTIVMALYQGLWSFSGWANLAFVLEEVKKPENSNKVLGSWGWVMSIAAALSSFGTLNGSFFGGGRVCFAAAREGHMPSILSMAHVKRLTPSPALIFSTIIAFIVLIPGDFRSVINYFSFTSWIFIGLAISGLVYLKIKKSDLRSAYKVPRIIPLLVLLASVFLVLAPIVDKPQLEYLYVTLFILSGVFIYFPFIQFKLCPHLLDKLTVFLQLFLEVPIIIPILVLLAFMFLVLAPIVDKPQLEYLYVTLFILSGALIYFPFIHFKLCPDLLDKLTLFLQLFLEVAPADKNK
ncbi:b(0,+)-type amino acid transporter 1-like isoform X1 [Silurus asotus]|uniref:B(0,+)-type amino acid transporter 1-like isoform X1 n=1 Tax=Silurus asotus TaxID=30991 RepID=A0AAD5AM72_SILAS|nr:b(0,+)-type amino acid transporter 1-like isoform X1 [Silurus asotus]